MAAILCESASVRIGYSTSKQNRKVSVALLPEVWSSRGITDTNSAAKNENTATDDSLTPERISTVNSLKATTS